MKILVLVKQVPSLGSVRFLPQINRIEREGVDSMTNPLDERALDIALELSGPGDEVVAATMGPPQACAVLKEAVARGASRGVHLVDPMFAGADTLATARTFARLVDRERPDLVLGGRTTVDGATAQVLPQLAELAGLTLATDADSVALHDGEVEITRRESGAWSRARATLPAAVSIATPPIRRPAASSTRHLPMGNERIEHLDAVALGGDPAGYGIRGSATYVQAVELLDAERACEVVRDPVEGLRRIEALATAPPGPGHAPSDATAAMRTHEPDGEDDSNVAPGGEIWVVVERDGLEVTRVSLEALAAAQFVVERLGASVVALCFGTCAEADEVRLATAGADTILSVLAPDLDPDNPSSLVAALSAAVELRPPLAVLGQWTVAQLDWLPRSAARCSFGMTGDVVGLDTAPRPGSAGVVDLVWLKPAWSGTALARVVARTVPSYGTMRPGALRELDLPDRHANSIQLELGPLGVDATRTSRTVESTAPDGDAPALDGARVVVIVGRGLTASAAGTARLLARHLGAAFARVPDALHADDATAVSSATHALSPRLAIVFGEIDLIDLTPVRLAGTVVSISETLPHAPVDLALLVAPVALHSLLDGWRRSPID